MKKRILYFLIFVPAIIFSACTFHFPYDTQETYRNVHVVFKVTPDDAAILLNGRYIGDAYEFSTPDSALGLSSKRNEIIVKREGYIEEVVNLYEYDARNITIRLKMREEKGFVRETGKEKVRHKPIARTVKEKEVTEAPPEEERTKFKSVKLTLEIEPEESSIYLDGKFWGISPAKGKIVNLKLKAGAYMLEIVKPGYKPYKKKLELADQEELKLTIRLIK
ncbi:MAG: PEGA domain-containing protein [Candidatus Aminicenantes bacterium]|nr:PEGA domain-containing protein [Candidatus Aminicenantes bacterium]